MRHGFLAGDGDWVVNFDIDYFSADFLKRVLALDNVDLVIASKRGSRLGGQATSAQKVCHLGLQPVVAHRPRLQGE